MERELILLTSTGNQMDGMAGRAADGTCRSRNYVRADAEKEKRLIRAAERGDAFNDSRSSSSVVVHHNLVNEPLMTDAEAQPRWGADAGRRRDLDAGRREGRPWTTNRSSYCAVARSNLPHPPLAARLPTATSPDSAAGCAAERKGGGG